MQPLNSINLRVVEMIKELLELFLESISLTCYHLDALWIKVITRSQCPLRMLPLGLLTC